jgi:hypothetical protein
MIHAKTIKATASNRARIDLKIGISRMERELSSRK